MNVTPICSGIECNFMNCFLATVEQFRNKVHAKLLPSNCWVTFLSMLWLLYIIMLRCNDFYPSVHTADTRSTGTWKVVHTW